MKKILDLEFLKRVLTLSIGSILAGFGIGIWNVTNLGYDPLNIFYHALSNIGGLKFSTVTLIGGVILLIITLLVDYKELGIGTFIALYLMSFGIEIAVNTVSKFSYQGIFVGIILHFIGLFILCFGVALIIKPQLGKAIYDALVFGIAKKMNTKFEYVRYILTDYFIIGFNN